MKKIIYSLMVLAMAAFTFSSCEDVPAPYDTPAKPTTPEASTTGTESDPYTVTDAKLVGSGSNVFVKGYIVGYVPDKSLSEAIFGATGDNVATSNFLIAASADETNVSNCMPVQLPVGAVRSGLNLKDNPGNLGQEVTLCGNIESYFGAIGAKSIAWAKVGDKEFGTKPGGGDTPSAGEAKGTGTKEDPFNSVAANNYAKSLGSDVASENDVYIKGKIREINEQYSNQYGNASVTIADDATSATFKIWRALYFNNQKWTEGGEELKEGDEVVFCGKVVNYKGNTPETVQGQAYLVSLNGKTSGGSVDPTPTPTPSEGLSIEGTTVTLTNSGVTAGTESTTIDLSTKGYENQQEITKITLEDGTTIDFDANGAVDNNGNALQPKYYNATKGIRVYKDNKIIFNGKKAIAKIVLTCDSYSGTNYVGSTTATITVSGNTVTYTNANATQQLRIKNIEIIYAK